MSLATQEDVEARLGRVLTDEEEAQIDALLEDVSAAVQVRTGQRFERGEVEYRARVKRGYVRLSQRPVHDVLSVKTRFGDDVAFEWDGLDLVYVECHRTGRAPVQVVDVVYDAGYDEVPGVIVGLVAGIAERSLGVDPTQTQYTQEQVDGYQSTIGGAGGARAFGVLPAEEELLKSFARQYGNIQVAW